jgi:hypothetical protein
MRVALFRARYSAILLFVAALFGGRMWSQEAGPQVDRTYPVSTELVQKGLQQIGGFGGGKLPIVDGFVKSVPDQPEHYEHPYYQYRVHLKPVDSGSTVVSVEAVITAWYVDADPSRSEYRSLPSNGRLEKDLLDRLQEALRGKLPADSNAQPAVEAPRNPAPVRASKPIAPSTAKAPDVPAPASGPSQDQLDAILAQRQAVREKTAALQSQIEQLKTADHKPVNASKLASIKHSGVGVMSRQNFGGPVLFRAQAEDEFEVVELQPGWAKVRLAADSIGYVQADELALPEGMAEKPPTESSQTAHPAANTTQDLGFSVSREDVTTFSGDWVRLKGKKVLFVYAQPRGLLSDMGNQEAKLGYAKRIFESRYRSVLQSKTDVEGVVVVFLGTRGGIAAATLADIRQWLEGQLPDEAFVNRCSLDPATEFKAMRVN